MANAIRSKPTIHEKCEHNTEMKFMYTLNDIFDEGLKFQECSLVFHNLWCILFMWNIFS